MKRFNIAKTCQILTTCIALGLFTSFAHTEPKPQVQTVKPELTEVKHDFFDKFSVAENVALPNAKKVFIEPITVSFDKRWLRDNRTEVSERYKEATKERYRKLLRDQLVKALEKNERFEVVETAEAADITLAPEILSLNIFGPDDGFKKTYVYTAGYAALDLDIYNTKTNKLIAEVYDRRETDYTDFTRTELATRATNYRYFKRLMGKWSSNIAEQLDAFAK
ncbi:DUF3313 family protein [Saccharophagus degradans]|uniref:DUF3313 family protein n=1 Tax=Saccharophagus degradans TaxID=86304 RepID=UPI0024780C3D|nr:DUF3313 family protein [Saccharophagus degradans]WGO99981.1 DUF3313 family protein [Saccharophagus degradans]